MTDLIVIGVFALAALGLGIYFFNLTPQNRNQLDSRQQPHENVIHESFEAMIGLLNREIVRGRDIVIQYDIHDIGLWNISIQHENAYLRKGLAEKPNLTLMTDCDTWLALVNGDTSGEVAYLSGKLKKEGDVGIFLQHEKIFDRKQAISC